LKSNKLRILAAAAALCYERAGLKKQLGDTWNDIGKIALSSTQNILTNNAGNNLDKYKSNSSTALCLFHSAKFLSEEGHNFEQ